MIKSILVALDESETSQVAKTFAIALAKKYKAKIGGIGVVDEPWITAPEAIPIGGAAFKVELDSQLLDIAKKRVRKLEKIFKEDCIKENIDFSIINAEGIPSFEIERVIPEYDALVIGKDASFHYNLMNDGGMSVRQLMKDNPRPLIVTAKELEHPKSKSVIVAYDGTFASERALHMAILLGLTSHQEVHIINVDKDKKNAKRTLQPAIQLCKNHGIKITSYAIESSKKPSKEILELITKVEPKLLVIGAFGHSGITHLFSGSCAKELMKTTDIPLFVYH